MSRFRTFFVIRRHSDGHFFDARTGLWWLHFGEATQYASRERATHVCSEWDMGLVCNIVCLDEREDPDTMRDGDEDPPHNPNSGEEWKNG